MRRVLYQGHKCGTRSKRHWLVEKGMLKGGMGQRLSRKERKGKRERNLHDKGARQRHTKGESGMLGDVVFSWRDGTQVVVLRRQEWAIRESLAQNLGRDVLAW